MNVSLHEKGVAFGGLRRDTESRLKRNDEEVTSERQKIMYLRKTLHKRRWQPARLHQKREPCQNWCLCWIPPSMHMAVNRRHLFIIHNEIKREVLDEEQTIVPQCRTVEDAQDNVPNAIGSCGAPVRPSAVRVGVVGSGAVAAAVAFCDKCCTMCRVFSLHSLVWFSLSFCPHFSPFASCCLARFPRGSRGCSPHSSTVSRRP